MVLTNEVPPPPLLATDSEMKLTILQRNVGPSGRGPLGRPAMNWTTKIEQFSRAKRWRDWKEVAADADRWMMEADNFIKFCTQ